MGAAAVGMIRFEGVRKAFDHTPVLVNVDLDVAEGEIFTILGRSGSGKSVLVSMLVGLLAPDAGRIWIDGVDVTCFQREEEWDGLRLRTGFLFQGSALYDSMTVAENISFPLIHRKDLTPSRVESMVGRWLRRVNLEESVGAKYPAELSGGMQRRVALARTLILEPKIVIYDEPTAGLDPITAEGIGELIRELQEDLGVTSVVVSHDVRLASAISHRLAVLHDGVIVRVGPLDDLKRCDHPEVRAFLGGDGPA